MVASTTTSEVGGVEIETLVFRETAVVVISDILKMVVIFNIVGFSELIRR